MMADETYAQAMTRKLRELEAKLTERDEAITGLAALVKAQDATIGLLQRRLELIDTPWPAVTPPAPTPNGWGPVQLRSRLDLAPTVVCHEPSTVKEEG